MQTLSAADVRRWERVRVAIPVCLVLNADKLELDTFTATMNISLSGVCIRTMLALVPKQEVGIVIKGRFSQTVTARVVWAREQEFSKSTIAGLRFLL